MLSFKYHFGGFASISLENTNCVCFALPVTTSQRILCILRSIFYLSGISSCQFDIQINLQISYMQDWSPIIGIVLKSLWKINIFSAKKGKIYIFFTTSMLAHYVFLLGVISNNTPCESIFGSWFLNIGWSLNAPAKTSFQNWIAMQL